FLAKLTFPGPNRPFAGGLASVGAGGGCGFWMMMVRTGDHGPRFPAPSRACTRQKRVPVSAIKPFTATETDGHGSNQPLSSASKSAVNVELGLVWRWEASMPEGSA